jgi:hypothetical protein
VDALMQAMRTLPYARPDRISTWAGLEAQYVNDTAAGNIQCSEPCWGATGERNVHD